MSATREPMRDAHVLRPHVLLFAMLGSAAAWALHMLGGYVIIAYGCTTMWGGRTGTRVALLVFTLLTLAVVVWSGWTAWREWRVARAVDRPTDDHWDARMGERSARVSFVMVVGVLGAVVFGIGVIFQALAMPFTPLCEAGVAR